MFQNNFRWYLLPIILIITCNAHAQERNTKSYPTIGKPCPNFVFHHVEDWEEKDISLAKLKGKPFILDFFTTGCTMCFASFPKINKFQREFSGKIQFLLIGYQDKYIRPSFETFKKRLNINIAHAYDTSYFNKFDVVGVPYAIWVDANGIVVAITTSIDVTDSNLLAFEKGQSFPFTNLRQSRELYLSFDRNKPFLLSGNGGDSLSFFQRSLFANWKESMGHAAQLHVEDYCRFKIPLQIVGWPLSALYKFAYTNQLANWDAEDTAYYGKYRYAPIYEMTDSSQFQFDWNGETNIFCYSQILPADKSTPDEMLSIMKRDLENAFGYKATIEVRPMPYLRLTMDQTKISLLKSKGGNIQEESYPGGINLFNSSISELISIVSYKARLVGKDLPLLDETGINYPIDIHFDAVMSDLNDVKKELQRFGLEISPGIKNMNVLVIRDKPNISKN